MVTYPISQETLLNLGEKLNTLYKSFKLLRGNLLKLKGLHKTLDLYSDSNDEATFAITRFLKSPMNEDLRNAALWYFMDEFFSRFPGCPLGESEYFIYTGNESAHISFNDQSVDLIYHSTGQY